MGVSLGKRTDTDVPVTWEGASPVDLVGAYVNVRPYYQVPTSRSSMSPARSPYTFGARVKEVMGDMVLVEMEWPSDSTPWPQRATFYPRELHKALRECVCPACAPMGDGIHELHGA